MRSVVWCVSNKFNIYIHTAFVGVTDLKTIATIEMDRNDNKEYAPFQLDSATMFQGK